MDKPLIGDSPDQGLVHATVYAATGGIVPAESISSSQPAACNLAQSRLFLGDDVA